ncbi:MAG: ATP-binding cassette domain-containing protein, partial [Paracoccus sp. (in: a-proteobacteria)]|nr:ATP-binding cassette domain-containing protein [Paracoccus sp. (in: a-proteobacteria)]
LVLSTIATRLLTAGPLQHSNRSAAQASHLADLFRNQAEVVAALGMRGATFARWRSLRRQTEAHAVRGADRAAAMTAFSRAFRLFLQTALLAAGAWLVLRDQLSPGAMIASSVMMGRALAPIDQLVGGWPILQSGLDGWSRLKRLLTRHPNRPPHTALPRPDARVEVQGLSIAPPGEPAPVLRDIGLQLCPGQALGVIGSSGAGKTSLARALVGAWTPLTGTVRLGGATLDQYAPDALGALIGYLPQQVTLFDGTIAENIARLAVRPDSQRVIAAARAADAHRMILALPQGYDTRISQIGSRLSGGQVQRIGLARALYPDPVLLVLDEPNANLDNDGSEALNRAIRRQKAKGGAVVIMAHRPAAILECDLLMVLERGRKRAFGPRDKILRQMVENSGQIKQAQVVGFNGGVT